MVSAFGSVSDYFRWAPRLPAASQDNQKQSNLDFGSLKLGSSVIIVSINGDRSTNMILGATTHQLAPDDDKAFGDGPLLRFEYNGLFAEINKDGEFRVLRKGAKKNDGDLIDKNDKNVGATIFLDKDGNVFAATDGGNQSLTLKKDGHIVMTTAKGVNLGGDQEHLVLGDTYTGAEKNFLQALTTFMGQLSGVASTLSASGTDPSAAAAGGQLTAAIPDMISAINTFSGQLQRSLSKKNTSE